MSLGSFISRMMSQLSRRNEVLWYHECHDLIKIFPHVSSKLKSQSQFKEFYDSVYPQIRQAQHIAFEGLLEHQTSHKNRKLYQQIEATTRQFKQASIVKRKIWLDAWNTEITKSQLIDADTLTLTGICEVTPQTANALRALKTLKHLSFQDCGFTYLPEAFGQLRSLESLEISNTELTTLPVSIGNLNALIELRLVKNHLTTLPQSLCSLDKLKQLDVSQNRIQTLPDSVSFNKFLAKFDLSPEQVLESQWQQASSQESLPLPYYWSKRLGIVTKPSELAQ